jgi:hypothetical protein
MADVPFPFTYPVKVVVPVPPFPTATVPDKLLADGATHVKVPLPVVDNT